METHDELLKFYKELEENDVDQRSIMEWLLTPFFFVTSRIVPFALGLPLQNNLQHLDRSRHDFILRRMLVSATYPKYSHKTGVMSKDIEIPSCTPGIENSSRFFLPRKISNKQNVNVFVYLHFSRSRLYLYL